ncbi:sarcosine oxidase subunit gamma family protein [Mesorhizobium sp. M0676]|uniref:sarcosine oxidase subunit gamma family protein n=1 Tax=Mesorhizobium sp. M0676 TaxID=2956984 RepID=UPI003339D3D3
MVSHIPVKNFSLSMADCALSQVEGWERTLAQFEASVSALLGSKLPAAVGETIRHRGLHIIRIAPRRLWLLADEGSEAPLPGIDPQIGCSVSLGEGRVRLKLAGPDIARVLSKCIVVDWHAPTTARGRAVQTSFHKVGVLLLRTDDTACDLLVPRSFARSLSDWIEEAD